MNWKRHEMKVNAMYLRDTAKQPDQGKVQNSISLGSYDSPWNVKGMPDLNGDGVADILWRNENNGANHIWLMNDDGTRNQIVDPGSLDSTWDIVGM